MKTIAIREYTIKPSATGQVPLQLFRGVDRNANYTRFILRGSINTERQEKFLYKAGGIYVALFDLQN